MELMVLNFFFNHTIKGRQVAVMSAAQASQHRGILTLAVLSEQSCEAVLKAVGRAVFSLFPPTMALEEKARVLAGDYKKAYKTDFINASPFLLSSRPPSLLPHLLLFPLLLDIMNT